MIVVTVGHPSFNMCATAVPRAKFQSVVQHSFILERLFSGERRDVDHLRSILIEYNHQPQCNIFNLVVRGEHFLIWNVQHLEEKSQILDVVGVAIVVNVEPKGGMRFWIDVSNRTVGSSTGNENGRRESSRSFWRHQTKVVVSVQRFGLQLVQISHVIDFEFIHIFLQIVREEIWNILTFIKLTVSIRCNQVIRFANSKNLSQTKRNFVLLVFVIAGKGTER